MLRLGLPWTLSETGTLRTRVADIAGLGLALPAQRLKKSLARLGPVEGSGRSEAPCGLPRNGHEGHSRSTPPDLDLSSLLRGGCP